MTTEPTQLTFRPMQAGEETRIADLVLRVFDEFVAPGFSEEAKTVIKNYYGGLGLV